MNVILAADHYGPAHTGSAGIAWWLTTGLLARGHEVRVVIPEPPVARPDQLAGAEDRDIVERLAARWPDPEFAALATRRLAGGSTLAAVVQRELLGVTGAATDPAAVDFRGVDGVIAVGSGSPHVRLLLHHAAGQCPIVTHLQPGDLELLRVPLIRHELRAHSLVTHWESLAAMAGAALRRPVHAVQPGAPSPRPPVAGDAKPPPGIAWPTSGSDEKHRRVPLALWIRTRAGAVPRALRAWQRETGATCAISGTTDDLPAEGGFIPLPALADGRLDESVAHADCIICEPGDAGDLPVTAFGAGRPLIAYRGSSAAAEVAASGGGWVVNSESSLATALAATSGERASRGQAGADHVAHHRSWDYAIQRYEQLL